MVFQRDVELSLMKFGWMIPKRVKEHLYPETRQEILLPWLKFRCLPDEV